MIGADRPCEVCTRLVCEKCATDWSTCDQPSGRVVRLGRTARVVEIDPSGRYALVARWRGPLHVFDLRALRWLEGVSISEPLLVAVDIRTRLTSDGRALRADLMSTGDASLFRGISTLSIHSGETSLLEGLPAPVRGTGVSLLGDHYWYVTETEQVTIISPVERAPLPTTATAVNLGVLPKLPATIARTYEPLPRRVVQAVYVEGARDLLVSATWGEIAIHHFIDGRIDRVGYTKTTGDVSWVAVGGDWLAAHVHGGVHSGITVWPLAHDSSIIDKPRTIVRNVRVASLSRDGRYVAAGMEDESIVVHRLDDDLVAQFDEHTDRIGFVKFCGDDHLLVTADHDNRVVLRPRTVDGYARAIMPVSIEAL